jgi:hypothetical protein
MSTKKNTKAAPKAKESVAPERKKGEIVIPEEKKVPRDIKKLTAEGCSEFENYEIVKIHRSEVKNAPYNPRTISDEARKKIKKNIKERGLMSPPIWNIRTGNLVGGHQRMSMMDALEGTKDYHLRVAKVDIDEVTEREQNVFLNNPEAQGDFDLSALAEMFTFEGFDVDGTGFDLSTIRQVFGDSPTIAQPEQLVKLSENMKSLADVRETITKSVPERADIDFYLVVVFKGHKERKAFTDALSLPDNQYQDGHKIAEEVNARISGSNN